MQTQCKHNANTIKTGYTIKLRMPLEPPQCYNLYMQQWFTHQKVEYFTNQWFSLQEGGYFCNRWFTHQKIEYFTNQWFSRQNILPINGILLNFSAALSKPLLSYLFHSLQFSPVLAIFTIFKKKFTFLSFMVAVRIKTRSRIVFSS